MYGNSASWMHSGNSASIIPGGGAWNVSNSIILSGGIWDILIQSF